MQLILPFFGLSPNYRPVLHAQLFDMVYYGKGFTWTELYNMPIWLRKFYYKKTEEAIKEQNKKNTSSKVPNKVPNKQKISKPSIAPRQR